MNMGLVLVGVGAILALTMDLGAALFIIVVVSMIDLVLFGWMWANDVILGTITFVELATIPPCLCVIDT